MEGDSERIARLVGVVDVTELEPAVVDPPLLVHHPLEARPVALRAALPLIPLLGEGVRHAARAQRLALLDEQLVVMLVVLEAAQVLRDVVVGLRHVAVVVACNA